MKTDTKSSIKKEKLCTERRSSIVSDPYQKLLEGICRQAVKDLHGKVQYLRWDAIDFFREGFFEKLTGMDGEEILQRLFELEDD